MRNRLFTDLNLIVLFILVAILSLMFFYKWRNGNVEHDHIEYASGWVYHQDGTPVDMSSIRRDNKYVTISRHLTQEEASGRTLCFISSNVFFNIYLDGQIIYDFHPFMPSLYGRYYGDYIHFVEIPDFDDEAELKIMYESLLDSNYTGFKQMELSCEMDYSRSLVYSKLFNLMVSLAAFSIGIFLVFIGMVFDKNRYRLLETVSLGAMSVLLALWTNNGTMIFQVLANNSAIPRVVEQVSLILLPIPTILFVASFTDMLDDVVVKIELALAGIDFFLTFILFINKIADYHDTLKFAHVNIGLGMIFIVYLLVKSIRKGRGHDRKYKALFVAFGILLLGGAGDMFRYYVAKSSDAGGATRMALIIFILILTYVELSNLSQINIKSLESEIAERQARVDGLTGLYNRFALNEYEDELRKKKTGKYEIILLDINELKTVNDEFGHIEGDKHIRKAAEIISKVFSSYGRVFRTGGDEFLAIVKDIEDYDKMIAKMDALQEEYNTVSKPPHPLVIAYGKDVYIPGENELDAVEINADSRMYECKKRLKDKVQI